MQSHRSDPIVTQLNDFLRGELAAVESYRQALAAVDSVPHRSTLELCARSHQTRAELLREEVIRRGAEPAHDAGIWGSLTRIIESAAAQLGERAAIAALEEGEDRGREGYRRDLRKLDASARELVEKRVLPEQLRTHDAISALKKQLASN